MIFPPIWTEVEIFQKNYQGVRLGKSKTHCKTIAFSKEHIAFATDTDTRIDFFHITPYGVTLEKFLMNQKRQSSTPQTPIPFKSDTSEEVAVAFYDGLYFFSWRTF